MASPSQLAANQANAQLSTGPTTLAGKARVGQNALRHGLTARHIVIRDDEHEEFAALQDALSLELDPQGATEIIVFQELVHAAWSLHRFRRIEAESSLGTRDDLSNERTTVVLDRLTRYQARAQRAREKALRELRALQTNRALRTMKVTPGDAPKIPALASINDLTKQTQSDLTAEAIELADLVVAFQTKTSTLRSLHQNEVLRDLHKTAWQAVEKAARASATDHPEA